jgi:hypothetical protein
MLTNEYNPWEVYIYLIISEFEKESNFRLCLVQLVTTDVIVKLSSFPLRLDYFNEVFVHFNSGQTRHACSKVICLNVLDKRRDHSLAVGRL